MSNAISSTIVWRDQVLQVVLLLGNIKSRLSVSKWQLPRHVFKLLISRKIQCIKLARN